MAQTPASAAKKKAVPSAKGKTPAAPAAAAAKKSAPQKKPASVVMLKAIFEPLAEDKNLPKKQANELLTRMVEAMTTHLKQGDRIRINGFGVLEVRNREARMGRNPATGAAIQIPASKKVAFRPAKELKDAV